MAIYEINLRIGDIPIVMPHGKVLKTLLNIFGNDTSRPIAIELHILHQQPY